MTGSIDFLDESLQFVKGVGPRRAEALANHGILTVNDLLSCYPRRYLDRSTVTPIRELRDKSEPVTVVGTVISAKTIPRGRRRFELILSDETMGRMKCLWFQRHGWVARTFKVGDHVAFHGRPQRYGREMSMVHPDFDKLNSDTPSLDTGRIIALYHGSAALQEAGVTSRTLRRVIYNLIKEQGTRIPEILPEEMISEFGLLDGRVARRAIHFPKDHSELELAEHRLKFEELFFVQLMLARTRQSTQQYPGLTFDPPDQLCDQFLSTVLPFDLTADQRKVLDDIVADCMSGNQMNRLLQGDVGCGKTVVAVASLLHAIENGYQTAIMAPTEILAEQHFASIASYMDALGISTTILKGNQKAAVRNQILSGIASGETKIVVGTHALIQEGVTFDNLGLAIVDEQHRFGVMQRMTLRDKGSNPHVLLMSATPIPRSLALTLYGDLDVSVIKQMPPGRKPVRTYSMSDVQRREAYDLIHEQLEQGFQAYIVYPLVEESEKLDLKDAESGFEKVREEFSSYEVGLVHGRMKSADKDAVMTRFKKGEIQIIVSTTVIEVGVDVPKATVMLIEHAERFGLSQLHQLRGRVGRSEAQSFCVLMYDYPMSNDGKVRIETMVKTTDGFKISEADLRLRGAGDFFGTRQSGIPEFKIADLATDGEILMDARKAAQRLIARNSEHWAADNDVLIEYFNRFCVRDQSDIIRTG